MSNHESWASILEVSDLEIGFSNLQLASSISFSLKQGEWIGVMGSNGVGKTTLIKTLLGLVSPRRGRITFLSQALEKAESADLRKKFSYIPQSLLSIPSLTLFEYYSSCWRNRFSRNTSCLSEEVLSSLQAVQLQEKKEIPLSSLSGGELRRALFGATLLVKPSCFIFDEPTVALDSMAEQEIRNILANNQLRKGSSGIIVSHDEKFLHDICERILVLTPQGMREQS